MKTKLALLVLIIASLFIQSAPSYAASMTTSINNATINEAGGPLSFRLLLSQKPNDPDTVSVFFSTNQQCQIAHENKPFTFDGQVVAQTDNLGFSVQAVNDTVLETSQSCIISYRTTSTVSSLNNLSYSQVFNIIDDNDSPATVPALNTTVLGPASIAEASSSLYTFGVGPSTPPNDHLTISASTGDQCELVVDGRILDYHEQTTPPGVLGAAIFSVRATNDDVVEGDHFCTVTHSLRTDDTTYSGITAINTQVPITDDEQAFDSLATDAETLVNRRLLGRLDKTDANNDGVEDSKQPHVVSFTNDVSGKRHAIEIINKTECQAISTPKTYDESELTQLDENRHFPHGLLDFRVICKDPGNSAEIRILLDDLYDISDAELIKSGKDGFKLIEESNFGQFETQNGNVTSITYTITDGGEFDEDREVNGVILDPVGIAVSSVPEQKIVFEINDIKDDNSKALWWIAIIPLSVLAFYVYHLISIRPKHRHKDTLEHF